MVRSGSGADGATLLVQRRGSAMTVRISCPDARCGASFEVAEQKLGQSGSCPQCGTSFILSDSRLAETVAYDSWGSTIRDVPPMLGRYEILRKLGHGGMGDVYLAHDSQLDRQVAIKVPHTEIRGSAEVLQRFYREAKTGARFQHPNFCPIHEVGRHEGWNYLVMAYIEGQTLASMIAKDGPMPLRRAAAITRKLAQALQEAHDQGITHRDLKPSNVMVNRRRELIIMDFGLARREGAEDPELTRSGVVLGSPQYMAPEQVRAESDRIGPATDIYALGVMLYEMLTARRPYRGALALVLGLIATSQPERPSKFRPDLDPELEAICLKAMAREPADRYPSMRALVAAIELYLERSSWTATGPSPNPQQGGPLPPVEEIQLLPEPEIVDNQSRLAFSAAADEPGSAYHLDAEPEAAATDDPRTDSWANPALDSPSRSVPKDLPKPPRKDPWPKLKPRRDRGRLWRILVDLSYVLICLAGLAGGVAVFSYWATGARGTIEIQPPGHATAVRIDGQLIPPEKIKRPLELQAGEHELLVTAGDRVVASQKFEVIAGTNPPLRVRAGTKPATGR
jgi:serine/threonine protein kinase